VKVSAKKELFDTYGRNARLYPAMLLMAPLFALPGVLSGIDKLSSGIATGIVGIALLYGLTHGVRALGKRAERRLILNWGELPTTRHLLWQDSTLDATTKRRYHGYLRGNGLAMPSLGDERSDAVGSREKIASAITWLRINRRGEAHKIVHSENAAYGFRRNLYGAKPVGIAISLVVTGISAWPAVHLIVQPSFRPLVESLNVLPMDARIGLVVSVASLFAWIIVVTPNWVRDAAEQYARALLETCDTAIV
jgi:hypothetical protein